jgi:hypothetical protein
LRETRSDLLEVAANMENVTDARQFLRAFGVSRAGLYFGGHLSRFLNELAQGGPIDTEARDAWHRHLSFPGIFGAGRSHSRSRRALSEIWRIFENVSVSGGSGARP